MESCRQLTTPPPPPRPSPSPPSQSFTIFPRLPAELRIHIWKLSLPQRRIIEIRLDPESKGFESLQPPPPQLSACAESRFAALERFTLAFVDKHGVKSIPFDFKSDILYIRPVTFSSEMFSWTDIWSSFLAVREYLNCLGGDAIERIRHLAVDSLIYDRGLSMADVGHWNTIEEAMLCRFRDLRELYSVTELGAYHKCKGEIEEKEHDEVKAIVHKEFVGRYKRRQTPWLHLDQMLNNQRNCAKWYGLADVDLKGLLMTDQIRIEWTIDHPPPHELISILGIPN